MNINKKLLEDYLNQKIKTENDLHLLVDDYFTHSEVIQVYYTDGLIQDFPFPLCTYISLFDLISFVYSKVSV